MSKMLSIRFFIAVALVLVLAAAAYGFAAANTVPASNAGDGSGAITGFTVSAIHYTIDATAPSANNMTSVTFTIAPSAGASGTAYVSLDGGTTWKTCSIAGGTAVTCPNPAGDIGVTPLSATSLQVVAAQ